MEESTNTDDIRRKVIEASSTTVELFDEKIQELEEWLKQKTHLPEIPSRHMQEFFLLQNKLDEEKSRKKLLMYYEIWSIIPDLYRNINPALPHIKKISEVVYFLKLPKLTQQLYSVTVFKFRDSNPDHFDGESLACYLLNLMELQLIEDYYAMGEIFLVDIEGISLKHFFKFGVGLIKKLITISEGVFSGRTKGIHFIHAPASYKAVITIIKSLLPQKIGNRLCVHKNFDTLPESVPKEILPSDYGGCEKTCEELNELQNNLFIKHKDRFDKLDDMRTIAIGGVEEEE